MIDRRELERLRMVSEEASYWFVRSRDETLNYAERRKLLAWLRRSPEHVAEMLRMVRMDGDLRVAELEFNLTEDDESNVYMLPGARRSRPSSEAPESTHSFGWNWKIAAAFVLVTVMGLYLTKAILLDRSLSTGVSEWQHQRLADGSLVHIGPRSDLRLSFGDSRRSVKMSRGEAVFEVAKDPARPFSVTTDLADVRAVGTTFGVVRHDGVVVTVAEGIVEVRMRGEHDGQVVRLYAGDQMKIPDDGRPPAVEKVDADRKLKWREGWVVFKGETIAEAVNEFNRRNRIQIAVEQQGLAARRLELYRFRVDDPESFAERLAERPDIELVRDPSNRVLYLQFE